MSIVSVGVFVSSLLVIWVRGGDEEAEISAIISQRRPFHDVVTCMCRYPRKNQIVVLPVLVGGGVWLDPGTRGATGPAVDTPVV